MKIRKFVIFVFIISLFAVNATALSGDEGDIKEKIYSYSGAQELEKALPESFDQGQGSLDPKDAQEQIKASSVFSRLMSMAFSSLKKLFSSFISLLAFIIFCALARKMKEALPNSSLGIIMEYITIICLSKATFSFIGGAFEEAQAFVGQVNDFMGAFLPVSASLYALGGNVSTAVVQNASVSMVITVLEHISGYVLFPALKISIAFSIAGAFSGCDISGINKLIKSFLVYSCVFLFTVLGAVLFFGTSLAASADSVGIRSAKFAMSSFIPIIGGALSEASGALGAGVGAIKSAVGVFGVLAVLYIAFAPAFGVVVKKLMLFILCAVAKLFGLNKESAFLEDISGIMNILLALIISCSVYFMLALSIFVKTVSG